MVLLVRGDCGKELLDPSLPSPSHVMSRQTQTQTTRTSEEIKALQLIGCSYCKALTLNLLYKLLPIPTVLDGRGQPPTSLQTRKKCIGAAATKPVKLQSNMWSYRWAETRND
jgi:hypothetical protein